MAATMTNSAGKVVDRRARLIVTRPSSSGWRSTSSVLRLNAGSSSTRRPPRSLWLAQLLFYELLVTCPE